MLVNIPSPLRSYTGNQAQVEAHGSSLKELLASLDASFPGIAFRMIDEQEGIRQHVKIFVDCLPADSLDFKLKGDEVVHIICALSGG
jgi:molybdopterin converting factor small subunit